MTNEQYEGLKNTFHDALEETIINIGNNTKKEIKTYTNILEKEILKQRKDMGTTQDKIDELKKTTDDLKNTIKNEFSNLKVEWDRLIDILNKLL